MAGEMPSIYPDFSETPLEAATDLFHNAITEVLTVRRHGHLNGWLAGMAALPPVTADCLNLDQDRPTIGRSAQLSDTDRSDLYSLLTSFKPWRKGPFELFGIEIDSEWRSDMKWRRLADQIQPLSGKLVLDIGCGNGYYICRMLGAGARYVLGIEPSQLFTCQFNTIKHFVPSMAASILPLRFEEYPRQSVVSSGLLFDTVFNMGILYHRKNPHQHLAEIRQCMRTGGELVLETLIIHGDSSEIFVPEKTYAKMPNVWNIPTEAALVIQLEEAGFSSVKTINITQTTVGEQRKTEWMDFESLEDFLDPDDPDRTIEGYPAPLRIVVTATA